MSKRILLPTDGSEQSRSAVTSGVLFAKKLGASLIGLHVLPVVRQDLLEAWAHHDVHHKQRQEAVFEKIGQAYLDFVAETAAAHDVPCTCELVKGDEPYRVIVKAAARTQCDLIYMASHGCDSDSTHILRILGSETLKVLTHSKVSVLIHKDGAA